MLGLRGSARAAGIGWLLHIVWDLAAPMQFDMSYAPAWTAPACLAWDVVVGGYLLTLGREKETEPDERAVAAS